MTRLERGVNKDAPPISPIEFPSKSSDKLCKRIRLGKVDKRDFAPISPIELPEISREIF